MANQKNGPEEPALEQDVIEDLEPVEDTPVPPRIAPPKLGTAGTNPIHSVLTSDDVEFIGKVFAQVRHVDFKAPVPEGNPRLTGIDKKLFGLREQVRKLERDLAHVAHIWNQKQQEIDSAAEWVRSKDEELIRATRHLEDTSDKLSSAEESLVELRKTSAVVKESLEEELQEQKEEVASLKLRLLAIQEELDREREEWATRIESAKESAEKQVEQALSDNQRSQRAYDALKGLGQSEKEAHALQQQTLRLQIAELGDRLAQSEIAVLDAQRKNVELGAVNSQKAAELEANSKSVALLQTQVEALQESATADEEKARGLVAELESQIQSLRGDIAELTDSTGITGEELNTLRSQLDVVTGERDAALGERDGLQGRLDELGQSHDAELQRQRTAHEQMRQQNQKDFLSLENLKSEIEAELAAIRVELGNSNARNTELEALSEKQTGQVRQLERKLQDEAELNRSNLETIQMLQVKLRNANQSLSESESGFVELKARLATSESDKNALAQRLIDLEN